VSKVFCILICLLMLSFSATSTAFAASFTYGAWLPYWDIATSLDETEALHSGLNTLIAFACLFDNNDRLLMPEETEELLVALQTSYASEEKAVFLSIVNDVEISDGKYENKSSALLTRLFQSEESQSRHLEELAALIDTYQLKGLELDYENIKGNTDLWASYALFIEKVWAMCQRDSVRLRIVLPWDAPKYIALPEGPEYSVMCYNLYGYHSGAGPKADLDFLKATCELYRHVPSPVSMAFATGGFDWHEGRITALTQEEAQEQLYMAQIVPQRDMLSGAMTATYQEDGVQHELWYADALTLQIWRDLCAQYGFGSFDLFRLGGNDRLDWEAQLFNVEP